MGFYARDYAMTPPNLLVTVYLVGDAGALGAVAARVHGIRPTREGIRYSIREDLSIVAIIPATTYGTLHHELFHLMARREFGNIPPWLDEGVAELDEVAAVTDTSIRACRTGADE